MPIPTNQKLYDSVKESEHNLPKFEGKGISKEKEILNYSNPKKVYEKAKSYLGQNVKIELSNNPHKKYMVLDPHTNKWVHFGQMGYEDFTKHKDPVRRHNYLQRTLFMKGNWRMNKYSPNNLSRNILW